MHLCCLDIDMVIKYYTYWIHGCTYSLLAFPSICPLLKRSSLDFFCRQRSSTFYVTHFVSQVQSSPTESVIVNTWTRSTLTLRISRLVPSRVDTWLSSHTTELSYETRRGKLDQDRPLLGVLASWADPIIKGCSYGGPPHGEGT
jgi:hypothetical protein